MSGAAFQRRQSDEVVEGVVQIFQILMIFLVYLVYQLSREEDLESPMVMAI